VETTADPKHPIPRLSKFVEGIRMEITWRTSEMEGEEKERQKEAHSCSDIGISLK
jgi:hypothetical protein